MKEIITGDLHLSHNPRDAYRFDFMRWLCVECEQRKPDRIVIAGDLTEEKDRHPAMLVNKVVECVHALSKIAPVDLLEGNHDYKDEGHAFFSFLSRIPNTRWIGKPRARGDVLYLPHTNNYKRDWADLDLAAYRFIIAHQTFNGASVGFGRSLDGIPLDVLPRKSTTLCGDVHVPQQMDRVVYIGAPYHVDFGDDYASRIIERTDRGWVSVDTSSLPQKRSFTIGATRELKDAHFNAGDVIAITMEVDQMESWPAYSDAIRKHIEGRHAIAWSVKPKLLKKAVRRKHTVAEARTDRDVLDAFGKRHGLSEPIMKRGEKLL